MRTRALSVVVLALVVGIVPTAAPAAAVGAPAGATAAAPAGAAGSGQHASRPDLQAALDEVVRKGASAAIAEVRDERGIWRDASGIERMGSPRPAPVDGRFRAGSVTKTFVATVILQLVAEGKLTLDDSVERWLPGLVPNGAGIMVRQLLNHTSGLYNYTEPMFPDIDAFFRIRFTTFTPQQLVRMSTEQPPYFPPGKGWTYSNTNYILAAMIIEKIAARPWAAEVRSRILRPLGLRNTYLPGRSVGIRGPHAHGHLPVVRGGEVDWVDISRLNPSWAWAAGEMISTTADLNKFFAALFGGRLLRPAELAAMRTTVQVEPGFEYGLGVFAVNNPCGGKLWGHSGGIHGYTTQSVHTSDGKRHVTLSANAVIPDADRGIQGFMAAALCPSAPTRAWSRPLIPQHLGIR